MSLITAITSWTRTGIFVVCLASISARSVHAQPSAEEWVTAGKHAYNKAASLFSQPLIDAQEQLALNPPARGAERKAVRESLQRKILSIKTQLWTAEEWMKPRMEKLEPGAFGFLRQGFELFVGRSKQLSQDDVGRLPAPARRFANTEHVEVMDAHPLVKVFQIIDEDELLIKINNQVAYVSDWPTEGMVDKMPFPDWPMYVVGTRRYEAAIGSNTVFELKPIPEPLLKELYSKITDEVKHPSRIRQWTDKTGKFSVQAELVSLEEKTATLKKTDGEKISLPLTRLSKTDREYCQEKLGVGQ